MQRLAFRRCFSFRFSHPRTDLIPVSQHSLGCFAYLSFAGKDMYRKRALCLGRVTKQEA